MNKQKTCTRVRDSLTQDKQKELDNLIAKFGIEDIFLRHIGKDETNTVCFPCADTYVEVVLSDDKLQSLHDDEKQLLDDIGNELQEVMKCTLVLTSHPCIMHNGSAVYQVGYNAVHMVKKDSDTKENGDVFTDYLDAVNKGS